MLCCNPIKGDVFTTLKKILLNLLHTSLVLYHKHFGEAFVLLSYNKFVVQSVVDEGKI